MSEIIETKKRISVTLHILSSLLIMLASLLIVIVSPSDVPICVRWILFLLINAVGQGAVFESYRKNCH